MRNLPLTLLLQWTRRLRACSMLFVFGGAPLTSDVRRCSRLP